MRLLVIFGMALSLASTARPDSIPPCQTDSLASYEALASGCLVGDLVFSDFVYRDTIIATEAGVPASSVTVTPILGPNVGLKFSGDFNVSALNIEDELLKFSVQTENGQPNIGDFGLSMDASFTGNGLVAIGENANNFAYHLEAYTFLGGTGLNQDKTIDPPLSSIVLRKDILVTGGSDGTASLVSFTETFSEVPEPSFFWLVTAGLPVMLYVRRRGRSTDKTGGNS